MPKRLENKRGKFRKPSRIRGFTLLEILLAMVILGGVVAVLGELSRSGLRSAGAAKGLAQGEQLCESIVAMARLGLIDLETRYDEPVTLDDFPNDSGAADLGRGEPLWTYSIEVQTVDDVGLLELAVTVRQNIPDENRPVVCRLVRWMTDPELETSEEESDATTSGSSSAL